MVIKVLIKTIGRNFYYENASTFIIIFLLAFGFLSGTEHRAIAIAIASNNLLCLATIAIWLLYVAKTVIFVYGKFQSPSYYFIWNASLISLPLRFIYFITVQSVLNLPVSLYALFVLWFGMQLGSLFSIVLLSFFLVIIHILPVLIHELSLRKYHYEQHNFITNKLIAPLLRFKKPEWLWPLIGSVKARPSLWFVSKPVAILLLTGFASIDSLEQYNIKWMNIGALVVFSLNLSILFETNVFEQRYLSIFKNLPVPKYKVLLRDGLMVLASLLPEVILLIKLFPVHHSTGSLAMLLLFGVYLNWVSYLVLKVYRIDLESYLRKYLFVFLLIFLFILSGVPTIIFTCIFTFTLMFIYINYYDLTLS
ncbi:MAG: hypothetical protein AAFN93_09780 [Bacteroidota bacterium]